MQYSNLSNTRGFDEPAMQTHQENRFQREELIPIIKAVLVAFAYAWWAVIVLYFGVLDSDASLTFKVLSFPIVWASFALCLVFQLSMKLNKNGFSSLFFIGLMVSGLLA
jgi:hypothetical protein